MGSGQSTADELRRIDEHRTRKPKRRKHRPIAVEPKSYKDVPRSGPPKTSKDELLDGLDFSFIDQHAVKAPHSLLFSSFWDLGDYLTDDGAWEDDLVKVRSVFRWVTSYNVKKMKIDITPPKETVLEYFTKIQCDIGNHANLFYILCQLVDVPCVVVDGLTKNASYKLGEPLNKKTLKSQWNAVYIKGSWRLIDVFWATTCVETNSGLNPERPGINRYMKVKVERNVKLNHNEPVDECYFFTEPRHLIWTHFPNDEKWQLLDNKMKIEEFEKLVYVRERMHELEVTYPSKKHRACIINLKQGKGQMELNIPPHRSKFYHFKYALYRTKGSLEADKDVEVNLNECVKMNMGSDVLHFEFDVPVSGKFNFEIYGKDNKTEGLKDFDLMCAYSVRSPLPQKKPLPLPDNPDIGWGPNMKTMVCGIKPITHKRSKIITEDGKLEIRIQGAQEADLQMELRSGVIDDASLTKYAVLRWQEGQYIINTRLPKAGHYIMKLCAREPKNGRNMENVLNYIIKCTGMEIVDDPFPNVMNGVVGPSKMADEIGVKVIMNESGIVEAPRGKTKIDFDVEDGVELEHELNSTDEEAQETMNIEVFRDNRLNTFELDLPKAGEYSLNVYATSLLKSSDEHIVYTFLIYSHGKPQKKKRPKSDRAYLESSNFEVVPESKTSSRSSDIVTKTIRTRERDVMIPGPEDGNNVIGYLEHMGSEEKRPSEQVYCIRRDGSNWFSVTLTRMGDYVFNAFQKNVTNRSMKNICRYRIRRLDINERDEEERIPDVDALFKAKAKKREDVTQNLEASLTSKSIAEIEKSMMEYQAVIPGHNSNLIRRAEQMIRTLEVRKDLLSAYEKRHLPTLERMINRAKNNNMDNQLGPEILLAERLCERLNTLKSLRKEVMLTDAQAITELKRYTQPPDGVQQVMTCTLLLLGHPPWEIETWAKCKAIIGRSGKESLKFKMADFDPRLVPLEVALDGKDLIEPFTEPQVRAVSPTAAAFYLWVQEQIREIEWSVGCLGYESLNSARDCPRRDTNMVLYDRWYHASRENLLKEAQSYLGHIKQVTKQLKEVEATAGTLGGKTFPQETPSDPEIQTVSDHENYGRTPETVPLNLDLDRAQSSQGFSNQPKVREGTFVHETLSPGGNMSPRKYVTPLPPVALTSRSTGSTEIPTPRNYAAFNSPSPRVNKAFDYRMNNRRGFRDLRKLGVIPDWK